MATTQFIPWKMPPPNEYNRIYDDYVETLLLGIWIDELTKGDNMKIIKKDNGIEVQYTTKKGKSKNLVFTSRTKFVEFLDKKLGGLLDD